MKVSWTPSTATLSRPRFATCDDGLDYCIKHDEGGKPIRANECICTALARASGIAVAAASIVQDLDGKLLFGSQIYGDDVNDNLGLFSSGGLLSEHISHIWKTYAFDLFVKNPDRHVNQYKVFYQKSPGQDLIFRLGRCIILFLAEFRLAITRTMQYGTESACPSGPVRVVRRWRSR